MTKAELFKQAIDKIKSDERYLRADYMSDMSNWCVVHATKYIPQTNPDGTMYIPSTAMATDFEIPRSTVHVTLNHVVASHGYGSWDDMPIVVLAPYNDVVEKNGNPAEVAGTDTYWSVNPDTGLVLPESAYIVQPDDNGPLFQIGEHGSTYKRDNYTEEEVAQIESMLYPYDREEYMKYKSGEIEQWDIEHEFYGDERVKVGYEQAKAKGEENVKAFLRGLFEETRFNILSKYLRDAVVNLSMQQIGMKYVDSIYDGNETSGVIAKAADAKGIPATASNKGHSSSIYHELEQCWVNVTGVLKGSSFSGRPGILNAPNMPSLYDIFVQLGLDNPVISPIVSNIIENKPVDFIKMYQDVYMEEVKNRIDSAKISIKYDKQELETIPTYTNLTEDRRQELQKEYEDKIAYYNAYTADLSAKKTINDYDKNLYETIRRYCARLGAEYNAWREKVSKQPGFGKLVQQLRTLVMQEQVRSGGRDDF